jgi:hypothetical protein
MIVGGAVGLHLIALLLLGNDEVAGIPASIDDSADVACGAVLRVATPPLVHLNCAVPAFSALRIDELTAFLVDVICIFCLDIVWEFTIHYYVHVFIERIKEVVIVVI